MHNILKSSIEDNLRMNNNSYVKGFAHKHTGTIRVEFSCAHSLNTIKIQELVRFHRILVYDSSLGGSNGTLC